MSKVAGSELRERREQAGLKAFEVAAHMGVHSTRVSQIEALAQVTTATAQRYVAALEALQVAKTTEHVMAAQ
jgi:transcriptional regulator with XRE-family HTH domain